MPQKSNKSVANKNKKVTKESRKLLLKDEVEGTVYGEVVKVLGDCRFSVFCYDSVERICAVRKIKKKKPQVSLEDIVLVGLRDFEEGKGDIIYVYNKIECGQLKKLKEIPSSVKTDRQFDVVEDEIVTGFDFDEI